MQPNVKASRVAAIDYGMARIGLALSDERKIFASPLKTLAAAKRLEQTVKQLLEFLLEHQRQHQYVLEEIIVGLPLLMSGKAGLLADEVQHFVELLRKATTTPVITWDERLTTVQAERSLRESGMTRKKRTKVVDTVSAAILLQSYLDSKATFTTEITKNNFTTEITESTEKEEREEKNNTDGQDRQDFRKRE